MTRIFTIEKIEKSEENKRFYDRRGYHMTGKLLCERIIDDNGTETETKWIVFKGSWTRYMSVRDCGDHFIIARYSRWDSVDKKTLEITYDVEDK